MRKGPGKGGGTDFTEVTGNSEDATERFATDSGSGIRLAILVLDKARVVPTGELIVGENGGQRGNSRGNFNYWWPGDRFDSDNRPRNQSTLYVAVSCCDWEQ